jgi:hypothetical protein
MAGSPLDASGRAAARLHAHGAVQGRTATRAAALTPPHPTLIQERIMTLPFGSGAGSEVFRCSLFLVFCNRLVGVAVAAGILLVRRARGCAALLLLSLSRGEGPGD